MLIQYEYVHVSASLLKASQLCLKNKKTLIQRFQKSTFAYALAGHDV